MGSSAIQEVILASSSFWIWCSKLYSWYLLVLAEDEVTSILLHFFSNFKLGSVSKVGMISEGEC